jgi:hypothetical protein
MTRDDISRMAEAAGFPARRAFSDLSDLYPRLERFAALVAAAERKRIESTPWGAGKEWIARAVEAEREACAKLAFNAKTYIEAAAAIRARGEK